MSKSILSAKVRKSIRAAANQVGTPYPIEIVAGSGEAPRLTGCSYHWTTPGGTPVRHPSAFARRGWPTVYHCSTRVIEVGSEWLAARGIITEEHIGTFAGIAI